MTMTIGQVRDLRDSAAECGDSEFAGNCFYPRVVAKLADAALDLHAQLQRERAELEERVAVWKEMMKDSLESAKNRPDLFVAMRSFSRGQADAFGIVLNDIHDLQRGVLAGGDL